MTYASFFTPCSSSRFRHYNLISIVETYRRRKAGMRIKTYEFFCNFIFCQLVCWSWSKRRNVPIKEDFKISLRFVAPTFCAWFLISPFPIWILIMPTIFISICTNIIAPWSKFLETLKRRNERSQIKIGKWRKECKLKGVDDPCLSPNMKGEKRKLGIGRGEKYKIARASLLIRSNMFKGIEKLKRLFNTRSRQWAKDL